MRAISTFSREAGTSTFWCRACSALRTLVSISATGSVNLIVCFSSRHPFAPRSAENLRQLLLRCHPERNAFCLAKDLRPAMPLPRRLRDARNLAAQRQPAEAQAAQAELAQISARTSANLAAVVSARGKFRSLLLLLRANSNFFSIFASFTRFAVVMKSLKNLVLEPETLKPKL